MNKNDSKQVVEHVSRQINLQPDTAEPSFNDWLNLGRSRWPSNIARALAADLLLVINSQDVIKAVGRIVGVSKHTEENSNYYSLEVVPKPNSRWLGQYLKRDRSILPIKYVSCALAYQE